MAEFPVPPVELRALVGRPDLESFLEPSDYPLELTRRVLDIGCGCGRQARWLLGLERRPERYLGIDIHQGMIEWDRAHLSAPGFEYVHQDVASPCLNPNGTLRVTPIPAPDHDFTLVLAISFFTHLVEDQALFYLDEVARVLAPEGVMHTTWFLFDKRAFPMMQDFQNSLYINPDDPTNAAIYDQGWLLRQLSDRGLGIRAVEPPDVRGFHWHLYIGHGLDSVELPPDDAPFGCRPPPVATESAP